MIYLLTSRGCHIHSPSPLFSLTLCIIFLTGAALCIVAKDLEGNLRKAEALFKKHPNKCKTLSSLLELERESDIHNGNVLKDPSAAMGLLWIRR